MYDDEVKAFIEEREKKLGAPLIYRSYATWFAELGRERREYGVFIYTDGKTLVIEDFFRPNKVLGYTIETKKEKERKENYTKLEIMLPLRKVESISYVSRPSVENSLRKIKDLSKKSTLFNKLFTKNVTKLVIDGRPFFFELPSFKDFKNIIDKNKEN